MFIYFFLKTSFRNCHSWLSPIHSEPLLAGKYFKSWIYLRNLALTISGILKSPEKPKHSQKNIWVDLSSVITTLSCVCNEILRITAVTGHFPNPLLLL